MDHTQEVSASSSSGRETNGVAFPQAATTEDNGEGKWVADIGSTLEEPSGGFIIMEDIDVGGNYNVILDPRALPPPAAITAAPMPEDVPAVNLIILQGDQVFHHQRSRHQRYQEEPPTHFHDDESDDEDFEGEVDAGSTFGPHVATIGPVDKGAVAELSFGPVLEAPVPRHEKHAAVKKDGEDLKVVSDNAQCMADY